VPTYPLNQVEATLAVPYTSALRGQFHRAAASRSAACRSRVCRWPVTSWPTPPRACA